MKTKELISNLKFILDYGNTVHYVKDLPLSDGRHQKTVDEIIQCLREYDELNKLLIDLREPLINLFAFFNGIRI